MGLGSYGERPFFYWKICSNLPKITSNPSCYCSLRGLNRFSSSFGLQIAIGIISPSILFEFPPTKYCKVVWVTQHSPCFAAVPKCLPCLLSWYVTSNPPPFLSWYVTSNPTPYQCLLDQLEKHAIHNANYPTASQDYDIYPLSWCPHQGAHAFPILLLPSHWSIIFHEIKLCCCTMHQHTLGLWILLLVLTFVVVSLVFVMGIANWWNYTLHQRPPPMTHHLYFAWGLPCHPPTHEIM